MNLQVSNIRCQTSGVKHNVKHPVSQIIIFIIEITLKQLLHKKYG